MPYEIAGYTASGNIGASLFVYDTGTPFRAAQAVANSKILGVASAAPQNPKGVAAFYGGTENNYAATDGQSIPIYAAGSNTVLYIAATISAGQFIASNANGYGVVATSGQNVGAVAVEGGFANQLIRVTVVQTLAP